jgi:hypothetical protein
MIAEENAPERVSLDTYLRMLSWWRKSDLQSK